MDGLRIAAGTPAGPGLEVRLGSSRPSSAAVATGRADAVGVDGLEGRDGGHALSPGRPRTPWTRRRAAGEAPRRLGRDLLGSEGEESAASAIRCAYQRVCGSSIVPAGTVSGTPRSAPTLTRISLGLIAHQVRFHHQTTHTSGTMIRTFRKVLARGDPGRSSPRRWRAPAARTARGQQAEAHPAQPQRRVRLGAAAPARRRAPCGRPPPA